MDELLQFLNALDRDARADFARRIGTTEGYLRRALYSGLRLGESLCINIERETDRRVTCEMLRDDVDWAYLRASCDCKREIA